MKRLAILGSTGSIGVQALEVVECNSDMFCVEVLTANNNSTLLIEQAVKFKPNTVVIANEAKYDEVNEALSSYDIKVFAGSGALRDVVQMDSVDMVLASMVGYAGLLPVMDAIKAHKQIALANKETLVVAGELITKLCIENRVPILPVDSEHSAIFQCLVGEADNPVEKIILTCSGGPFRNHTKKQLETVTSKDALAHPNWNMGAKITIDSATLMNKGFEVIEAKWLFDVAPEQIEIVVHPQSIIHSMVQFVDGSVKAQLGLPDMKLPIQYAMTYPQRVSSHFDKLSFSQCSQLTFSQPDTDRFPCLSLAFDAISKGGNLACVMNAANEVAVAAFLKDEIPFLRIPDIIAESMNRVSFIANPTIDDYMASDIETRRIAAELK